LISADGHVLTVWSHVLDSDEVVVTLNDGRRFEAELLGADPKAQIAVLKIEGENLPHFNLHESPTAEAGAQILAFSNLFGVATGNEPVSVLHGMIAAKAPLDARSGAFESLYRGPAYILDAITNNPGAAGGALTNREGELLGLLGKELRNALNNTWLNYAIPVAELTASVEDILAGKLIPREQDEQPKLENPLRLATLGVVLVPDVLDRTPPYIDDVRDDSPAAAAGLRPDDLIVFVNDRLAQSCRALGEQLDQIEHDAPVKLTVLRDQQLLEFTLRAEEK
jgi:serine protease Do